MVFPHAIKIIFFAFCIVLTPIVIGSLLGAEALGGMLMGATLVGVLLALFMSNGGGAWDNAKKHVEAGNLGGKGSDAHHATVVGDTVGDVTFRLFNTYRPIVPRMIFFNTMSCYDP